MNVFIRFFLAFSTLSFLYSQELTLDQVVNASSELLKKEVSYSSFRKFPAGVGNEVYAFESEDGTQFVAKVFTKSSLSGVNQIEASVAVLRELGFSIPQTRAIASLNDHYVLHIADLIKGVHVDDSDLLRVAQLMAKLHKTDVTLFPKLRKTFKGSSHYAHLFEVCRGWHLASQLKEIFDGIDLTYLESIPLGVVHGDFSYSNIIRSDKERLTVIDFDHLCSSYLLTDVARCQMFYGFDQKGEVLEDKISSFVTAYHRKRALTQTELDHFYDHMKLMMIDTALEMYYHMHVLQDLPFDVINHPENKMLMPDLLARKIMNLKELHSIRGVRKHFPKKRPIIFFGLSGVGKTSVIKAIHENYPEETYIPKFTCTRAPRMDDDERYFEYVSQDKFDALEKAGAFAFSTREKGRCYGYQWEHLNEVNRYPLMNCSVFGIKKAKAFGGMTVLIKSSTEEGISQRLLASQERSRKEVNKIVQDQFLTQEWFINLVDIIEFNRLNALDATAVSLMGKVKDMCRDRENE